LISTGELEPAHAHAFHISGVRAIATVSIGQRRPIGGGSILPELRHPVLQPAHVPGAQDALLQHAARGQADSVQLADAQQPVAHRSGAHLPGTAHQSCHRSSLHTRTKRKRTVRAVRGHRPVPAHRHCLHRPVRRHSAAHRPGAGAHQVWYDSQQRKHTERQLSVSAGRIIFAGK